MSKPSPSSNSDTELQTVNVFVDTSIFRSKAFDLDNEALKKLGYLGEQKKIHLYSTLIIEREIRNNLFKAINESLTKPDKLNVHLRNAGLPEIHLEHLKEARFARWCNFIDRSNLSLIPIPPDSIDKVFALYFDSRPPFKDEARKRNEFPDAFNLAALNAWCEANNETMYVIADDNALIEACNGARLLPLHRLEEFLDLYNRRESLYQLAHLSFIELKDAIERAIKDRIEGRTFNIPRLYESDVYDVEVNDITLHEPLIIDATEEMGLIDIDADIFISAYISYSDPEMGYLDSEDRMWVEQDPSFSHSISGSFTKSVSIKILFEKSGDPNQSNLESVIVAGRIKFRLNCDELSDRYEVVSTD
jgi:hypothetical protein